MFRKDNNTMGRIPALGDPNAYLAYISERLQSKGYSVQKDVVLEDGRRIALKAEGKARGFQRFSAPRVEVHVHLLQRGASLSLDEFLIQHGRDKLHFGTPADGILSGLKARLCVSLFVSAETLSESVRAAMDESLNTSAASYFFAAITDLVEQQLLLPARVPQAFALQIEQFYSRIDDVLRPEGAARRKAQVRGTKKVRYFLLVVMAFLLLAQVATALLRGSTGIWQGSPISSAAANGIYFIQEGQVVEVPSQGGELKTHEAAPPFAAWLSPNKSHNKMAVFSYADDALDVHLYEPGARSSHTVYSGLKHVHSASLASDGASLLVSMRAEEEHTTELFRVHLADKKIQRLSENYAEDFQPREDAAGQWLYFASNRVGNFEIFRSLVAGGDVERISHSHSEEFAPQPLADGKSLLFLRSKYFPFVDAELMLLDLQSGETRSIHKSVAADRMYSPALDGESVFLFDRNKKLVRVSLVGNVVQEIEISSDYSFFVKALWQQMRPDKR